MTVQEPPRHVHFGLLVTGKTERTHLPKLFRRLTATGACHFTVVSKIEQLSPRTSAKKIEKLKIVGRGGGTPNS